MKIKLASDLHLEFDKDDKFEIPFDGEDVLVLAGDIQMGLKQQRWFVNHLRYRPIVYVMGNHEFYKQNIDDILRDRTGWAEAINAHANNRFCCLHNESVVLGGVRFVGATLWTDFANMDPAVMAIAPSIMNDYRLIREGAGYSRLTPARILAEHVKSRNFIEERVDDAVVITHHLPSFKSVHPRYRGPDGEMTNPFYFSNLDHLVDRAKLWLHGHTHESRRYENVCCNPRGYMDENKSFDPHLLLSLD